MKCNLCKTEAKIARSTNVLKGEKLYRRMVYVCRDKNCQNYEKEIMTEDIELEVTKE